MNSLDYQAFYDKVGKTNGWDFSHVKCVTEGTPCDLYGEVRERLNKRSVWLDIGTGGGEAVLSIAESALLLLGIDQSAEMIVTAARNAERLESSNVRFLQMDAAQLAFPNSFFDVVSCRHSEFYANEIARVLVKGGTFLTQQVSEHDKLNLKEAFGRGQCLGVEAGTLRQRYIKELSAAGFSDIQSFEVSTTDYYERAEDLIFLLRHTPIIPNFGETEADFATLQRFIEENQTDRGIRTSSERFMIIATL